jgi:hypothetical protein
MCAYATVVSQALRHGAAAFAWDVVSDFPIYDRTTGGFNDIKDILIYTYLESPSGMKISQLNGTSIKVQWQNRNTESDSIVIKRKVDNGSFDNYLGVDPTDSEFIDSTVNPGKSYYYRLKILMKDSTEIESYPVMLNAAATSIHQLNQPVGFELFDNYPNPFNPTTTINYSVPKTSLVTIKVYDILEKIIATLVNEGKSAGNYSIQFPANIGYASAVYFYRMQADNYSQTKKFVLLK